MAHTRNRKKWSAGVTTDSTHPPEGLFEKSANAIARTLASKRVSPKGPGSGMRMLTFYINRAGKNLSAEDRARLGRAKTLLSERVRADRGRKKPRKTRKKA
jgi:tRNA(adenine34) deaminase